MFIKISISSVRIISKSAAAVTLLSCFLSINFHSFSHFHSHQEKVESHFPDSRENEQDNISEQCDECLNKDKNSYDLNFSEITYFVFSNKRVSGFENHIGHSLPFNLHCRPPPRATT